MSDNIARNIGTAIVYAAVLFCVVVSVLDAHSKRWETKLTTRPSIRAASTAIKWFFFGAMFARAAYDITLWRGLSLWGMFFSGLYLYGQRRSKK